MHPPSDRRPPDARKTIVASRPDEVGGSAARPRTPVQNGRRHGNDLAIAVVRRKPAAPRPRTQSLQARQLLNPAQTAFDAVCRQLSPDTSWAVSPAMHRPDVPMLRNEGEPHERPFLREEGCYLAGELLERMGPPESAKIACPYDTKPFGRLRIVPLISKPLAGRKYSEAIWTGSRQSVTVLGVACFGASWLGGAGSMSGRSKPAADRPATGGFAEEW